MKILFYIRVSTADQKVGLEKYRNMAQEFCKRHSHELIEVYADEDVSGGTEMFKRKAGKRLLDDLKAKKGNAVATPDISRLFRDLRDGVNTLFMLEKMEVPVYSADMYGRPLDTNNYMDFAVVIDQLKYAHMERLRIKQRTKDTMTFRRRNGKLTSNVPYGYKRVKEGSEDIIEEPNEQKVIAKIMEAVENQVGFTKIAEILNRNKIPTKLGKTWHSSTVKNIYEYQLKLM